MQGSLFKTAWGKFVAFVVGAAAVAGIVFFVLKYQDLKFRNVVVNEVMGKVTVSGGKNADLMAGEHLVDGDYVAVASESALTLCADSNKFLRADENTSFKIETGNVLTGKGIRIVMDSGSTLSTLDEKLKDGEFWQVDTPTSSMAVRGTSFRVTVYKSGTSRNYTLLEVEKGSVRVSLAKNDGKPSGEDEIFEAGESAIIKKSEEKDATFIKSKAGDIRWELDYDTLPEDSVERLVSLIEDAGEQPEPQPEPEPQDDTPVANNTPRHTHTPGEWEITKPNNCNEDGVRIRRCTECGETVQSTVIPAAHDYEVTYHVDNCEDGGEVEYTCRVCGHSDTAEYPPQDHQWVLTTLSGPGVAAIGGGIHYECEICGRTKAEGISGAPDP